MLHLAALPGDPGYDSAGGIAAVVARAREELDALQSGGVDGVMISNEFSLPYLTKTEPITAITMARIIGELLPELEVPYGVNVLWDGRASIDLAVATGAKFVREIFTGVYASDFGLWNTNVGEVARHRARVGGADVKLFFNIVPESATYLADARPGVHHPHHGVRDAARRDLRVRRDGRIADRRRGAARGEVGRGCGAGVREHRCARRERRAPNSTSPTARSSAPTSRRTACSRTGPSAFAGRGADGPGASSSASS